MRPLTIPYSRVIPLSGKELIDAHLGEFHPYSYTSWHIWWLLRRRAFLETLKSIENKGLDKFGLDLFGKAVGILTHEVGSHPAMTFKSLASICLDDAYENRAEYERLFSKYRIFFEAAALANVYVNGGPWMWAIERRERTRNPTEEDRDMLEVNYLLIIAHHILKDGLRVHEGLEGPEWAVFRSILRFFVDSRDTYSRMEGYLDESLSFRFRFNDAMENLASFDLLSTGDESALLELIIRCPRVSPSESYRDVLLSIVKESVIKRDILRLLHTFACLERILKSANYGEYRIRHAIGFLLFYAFGYNRTYVAYPIVSNGAIRRVMLARKKIHPSVYAELGDWVKSTYDIPLEIVNIEDWVSAKCVTQLLNLIHNREVGPDTALAEAIVRGMVSVANSFLKGNEQPELMTSLREYLEEVNRNKLEKIDSLVHALIEPECQDRLISVMKTWSEPIELKWWIREKVKKAMRDINRLHLSAQARKTLLDSFHFSNKKGILKRLRESEEIGFWQEIEIEA